MHEKNTLGDRPSALEFFNLLDSLKWPFAKRVWNVKGAYVHDVPEMAIRKNMSQ